MPTLIGAREFTEGDQEWFAAVSGDRNPMHMDAVAARRTIAHFPVVHGMHASLWALDVLFQAFMQDAVQPRVQVKVNFAAPVLLGDHVRAVLIDESDRALRINIMVEETTAIQMMVRPGGDQAVSRDIITNDPSVTPTMPLNLTFDQMTSARGAIRFAGDPDEIGGRFPAAARVLDARRLAALASSSFLVGMICPGLHSIYRGLELVATALGEEF